MSPRLASALLLRHYAAVHDSPSQTSPHTRPAPRTFPARFSAWPEVERFAQDFARTHAFAEREFLRLVLVVEELFTNSVKHGYGGECEKPIEITLQVDGICLAVRYRDQAPPYDPFSTLDASRQAMDLPIEQRPAGHLGLVL